MSIIIEIWGIFGIIWILGKYAGYFGLYGYIGNMLDLSYTQIMQAFVSNKGGYRHMHIL